MKYNITEEEKGKRVDLFLAEKLDKSRSQIQKFLKSGKILLNDELTKNNYKLAIGDELVTLELKEEIPTIEAQELPLNIVYEDQYLMVVNKPSNMVVHPAVGNYTNTLVNGLMFYSDSLSSINGEFRPGIVHRIDKNTSGLLLVAKTNEVHALLSEMIRNREVKREYKAIVHGNILEKEAIIKAPIGRNPNDRKKMMVTEKNAKDAETKITVLDSNENYSLVKCELKTGRTHQIRVHLKYINHPVLGDEEYGPKKTIDTIGQALHAYKLSFIHPKTLESIVLRAPYPEEFENSLKATKLSDNDNARS